jgi:hypothetical protein
MLGGRPVLPVALRAAAGAAISVLHGRRVSRGFPRQRCRGAGARHKARGILCLAVLYPGLCHGVRCTGSRCFQHRCGVAPAHGSSCQTGRPCHHCDGAALPRGVPDRSSGAGSPVRRWRQAGHAVGSLCDGAGLCLWLDTMHRTGAGRRAWGCRGPGDRQCRRDAAGCLFTRPRRSVLDRGAVF